MSAGLSEFELAFGRQGAKDGDMNRQTWIGILLIVGAVAMLAYGGFTTTSRENILEVGALKGQADVKEEHRIPPAVSLVALAAGLVLLATGLKKK